VVHFPLEKSTCFWGFNGTQKGPGIVWFTRERFDVIQLTASDRGI
jgi:hypothetical protein